MDQSSLKKVWLWPASHNEGSALCREGMAMTFGFVAAGTTYAFSKSEVAAVLAGAVGLKIGHMAHHRLHKIGDTIAYRIGL